MKSSDLRLTGELELLREPEDDLDIDLELCLEWDLLLTGDLSWLRDLRRKVGQSLWR